MQIYALNGGPRKTWNTGTMLDHFVRGAQEAGGQALQVQRIDLFELDYKGCISCFACKRDAPGYGRCGYRDEIHGLLQQVGQADGLALASPIYFHDITAQLRAFLERLWFPYHSFVKGEGSIAPKSLHSAMIYTMNVSEAQMRRDKYDQLLLNTERYMEYHFHRKPQLVYAFDTYEFTDYSHYRASYWDAEAKAARRQRQFPLDCRAAYGAGRQMVADIRAEI